LNHINTR